MLTLQIIARALGGEVNGGQVRAPGPDHSAADRSLSIKLDDKAPDGFVVHSFSGNDAIACRDYVRQKIGLPAFKPNGSREHASSNEIEAFFQKTVTSQRRERSNPGNLKIVKTYDYRSADGELLYQVLRLEPKDFRQRQPDGQNGWIWRLDGRRVLYRWPELKKYPDATVFITEGEKDADRVAALGHCATTVATGKWTDECVKALADRDVIILEDNDDAGRKKAKEAAQALNGTVKSIRIVALPDLPEKGDVSDWLDADTERASKLVETCFNAPVWTQKKPEIAPDDHIKAFTFLGDTTPSPPRELIKKLLPADGVVVLGGQSSAGKTFIEIYKAICLATTRPFFGHKVVEKVGSVLVAAEGRSLIPNRLAAALKDASITEKLPIAWINQLPDFSSAEGTKLFIQQLKAIDKRLRNDFGVRLGQFTVDTLAASFGMMDEDDNAEATKVCKILRTIGEEVGALASAVHHYGKNPESGLRGASAFRGSAEVVIGALADIDPLSGRASNRELVCSKARDGEQGSISPFELRFVELGIDEDGEGYGSCCVVPMEGASRFEKSARVPKGVRAIQEAIDEVLSGLDRMIVPRAGMPSVRAAKVSDVRTEFDRRYVVADADPVKAGDAKRMAFKRALDTLPATKFGAGAFEGADWIWRI